MTVCHFKFYLVLMGENVFLMSCLGTDMWTSLSPLFASFRDVGGKLSFSSSFISLEDGDAVFKFLHVQCCCLLKMSLLNIIS